MVCDLRGMQGVLPMNALTNAVPAAGTGEPGGVPSPDDLIAAVAAGANRDLATSETLPPAAYTSKAFYDLEVEKVFRPGWVCVGHVSQAAEPGDYFTVDLFNEMLVVVRGKDEVIRTMSRICLHRWAPLVNGEGNTKLLSCPFHKWGFDLEGRLLGAPLMDQVSFEPGSCRLPQFRTEINEGFIYVNMSGEAAPLGEVLKDFSAHVARFRLDDLVVAGSIAYDCRFNWKIMVETFMECYHHIAAHPETFEASFPARMSFIEDGREGWTLGYSPARDSVPDDEILIGTPMLSDDLTPLEARAFQLYLIYPSHLISIWPDRVYWFRSQPAGPGRTLLQAYVLVRPEARDMPGFDALMAREMRFLDTVNLEDIAVNEMQQLGAATGTAETGRLSHLEKAVWQLSDFIRAKTAL